MVPAKSIAATTALTATHPIMILEVNLDLQESGIKILCLQIDMLRTDQDSNLRLCKLEKRMGN
jgi:hypothetical protein